MFTLNQKSTLIILRWLAIFFLFCFLLFTEGNRTIIYWRAFIIIFSLYFCSNIVLSFIPLRLFKKINFNYLIFLFDVILISLGIYFTQGLNSDIYLVYFLVIFIPIIRQETKGSIIIGIVSSILYLGLILKTQGKINVLTTEVLLRIPFLFLISLIGCYITEQSRLQKEKIRSKITQMEKVLYLGESISGIVHQLRNPINSIVMFCESILLQNDINIIKSNAKKAAHKGRECANFIEKFLGFVRGGGVGQVKTNITNLIMDILELNRDQFKIDKITVTKQLRLSLPDVYIDRELLQQVFLNIIHNARQSIVKTKKPGEIIIKTDFDDKNIKITFTDTGTGISKENLEKIFESFFTTKEPGVGTGLGLSISKDIIEKHNGKIYALSKEGKGATIVIELPLESQKKIQTKPGKI